MRNKTRCLAVGCAVLLVAGMLAPNVLSLLGGGALAQAPGGASGPPPTDLQPDKLPLPAKPPYPKLDSQLNRLVERSDFLPMRAAGVQRDPPAPVTIHLSEGNAPDIAAFLQAGGGVVANVGPDYIEAYAPVGLLPELGEKQGVSGWSASFPPCHLSPVREQRCTARTSGTPVASPAPG